MNNSHPTLPILEFDPAQNVTIEPAAPHVSRPAPQRGVLCFFPEVIQGLLDQGKLTEIGAIHSEIGLHPLYVLRVETIPGVREILIAHPGSGAPLAAGILEKIIALGTRSFIACGGCRVLRPEIGRHPVILTSAVRDEGTSYHYLPPSREAFPAPPAVTALEGACQALNIEYQLGKAWTTDAIYRETLFLREQRLAEGCDVVEMEAAAFFAVAQFRGVTLGQVVCGGDLIVPKDLEHQAWKEQGDDRLIMFRLAVEACLRLETGL